MARSLLLLAGLALAGCTAATAEEAPAERTPVCGELDPTASEDVRTTTLALQDTLKVVRQNKSSPLRSSFESAQRLAMTCPYNRASFQLPRALYLSATAIDAESLDPELRADWRTLQLGLETHVSVLDHLGAGLPLPTEGSYLGDKLPEGAAITVADLAGAADPVAATMPLLEAIRPIVGHYDAEVRSVIDEDVAALVAATGDDALLGERMQGWLEVLNRIEPGVKDPAIRAQVRQMVDALEVFSLSSC